MMLSEGSRFAREPSSPGPSSPVLSPSEATYSKTARTNADSYYIYKEQNASQGAGFADLDGPHSSLSVDSPSTPEISYLPTPPDTPERLYTRPKSEGQPIAPDLPTLPEESGIPSPSPLSHNHIVQDTVSLSPRSNLEAINTSEPVISGPQPENHILQDTDSSSSFSVLGATTSDWVAPSPVEPDLSFAEWVESDSSEKPGFLGFFRNLLGILASSRTSRARARKARVQTVIRLIKAVRDEKYIGTQASVWRTLHPSEYRDLLKLVEKEEALRGFFYEELR